MAEDQITLHPAMMPPPQKCKVIMPDGSIVEITEAEAVRYAQKACVLLLL